MPPVFRQSLPGGWVDLSPSPEGRQARCLDDPAFDLLLLQVRLAAPTSHADAS